MDLIKDVKEVLLALIAFGTVSVFFIRVFNGFFIEKIKLKYKNIPCKQSTFEVILILFGFMIIIGDIFILAWYIYDGIKNTSESMFSNSVLNFHYDVDLIGIIAILIVLLIVFMVASVSIGFKIENLFIDKFEKGNYGKVKPVYKLINILGIISSCIFIIIFIIGAFINIDIQTIAFIGFLAGMGTTVYLIQISILEVIKEIESNNVFIMYLTQEIIYCPCFLEYDDYYLLFDNGVERCIKKSEIREIRKVIDDTRNIIKRKEK